MAVESKPLGHPEVIRQHLRPFTTALKLTTMGLLGILFQARQRSLISSVAPLLDRLEQAARFWMAPSLRASILRAAGESP